MRHIAIKSILPWLGVILIVCALALIACAAPPATGEPPGSDDSPTEEVATEELLAAPTAEPTEEITRGQGGTLRLLYWQAPTILNPHLSLGTKDLSASRITYEPLASVDADGELVAFLAAEIPTPENGGVTADGLSVTWKLRRDIFWSDGEPFTADDVLFTYEYVTNPDVKSTSASTFATVESVGVIDDHTVKVTFKEPTAAWYAPFVGSLGMILPRHVFEEYNGANAAEAPANLMAVGTGPYRVVEYIEEDVLIIGTNAVSTIKVSYEANPYFREPDKPYFGRIELQGGGDLDVAAQAMKAGLFDFAWNLSVTEDLFEEMESGGLAIGVAPPSSFVERVMINFTDPNQETEEGERSSLEFPHPILTDRAVRQAIALGIDREAIAAAYGRGGTFTPYLLVEPAYFVPAESVYAYDPERAAAILEEAGWSDADGDGVREKDGVRLRLVHQTSIQPLRQFAQAQIKHDLEAIGFDIELKQIDSSVFLGPPKDTTDTRRQFYTDLEQFAFSNKSPDPAPYMAGWVCDQAAQMEDDWSRPNWARYCNPEFDALYEQALTELDPEQRIELFVRMNDLLIKDAAVIPLVQTFLPVGLSVTLKGWDFTPWDVEVWNIMDWYREE